MQDTSRIPTGSVGRRGGRWLAQLPPSMGRKGKIHDTEAEARLWLRQRILTEMLGIQGPERAARLTVSELIDSWLDLADLAESTRIDYRIRTDRRVKPQLLGSMAIGDVLPMHINACLQAAPANWTRIHVAKILSPFFAWAEVNRFTVGNPYRQSDAKSICKKQRKRNQKRDSSETAWTPEQLVTFVEHESDPVFRDYWVFVAATGARRGESIGARWSNMHAAEGWCLLADNITTAGNAIIHGDAPKNGETRKAYFGPVVAKMLLARHDDQEAYRAGHTSWSGDWVFDRRRGKGPRFFPGVHLAPATVTARFNRQAKELGLPYLAGPHGLRRTFSTIAEAERFLPSVRTKAMGHTPDIHGLYPKPSVTDMQALAERLAELILPNG